MTKAIDLAAGKVIPTDVITRHPDHPEREGEWTITHVRRSNVDHRYRGRDNVRLDYRLGEEIGCFVIPASQELSVLMGGLTWLDDFSHRELGDLIAFIVGYKREAVAEALAYVQKKRDRLAVSTERRAVSA